MMNKSSYNKEYWDKNSNTLKEKNKNYSKNNKENISLTKKKYYQEKKETILKKKKEYYLKKKEEIKEVRKKYYEENKNFVKQRTKKYFSNKLKSDPAFRIYNSLRVRVRNAIISNNIKKHNNTEILIGCDIKKAKEFIESKFKENMTWDNYGYKGWHIDHIRPCASFDLSNIEEQKQCFHYTNLQPLWWWENLEKSSKFVEK